MGRDRIIGSPEEMVEFGRSFALKLVPGTILTLSGEVGSGKTTFVQGLAEGLQVQDVVQSPTFVYLHAYEGTIPLFHFDLYRLDCGEDFVGLGFDEYLYAQGVCAIEWPERVFPLLEAKGWQISFSHHPQGRRVVYEIDAQ